MKKPFIFFIVLSLCRAIIYSAESSESSSQQHLQVTASDYCDFLNHVATVSDPNFLYNVKMSAEIETASIIRIGVPGNFHYEVIEGKEDSPIFFTDIGVQDSYCKWNGKIFVKSANFHDSFLKSNQYDLRFVISSLQTLSLSRSINSNFQSSSAWNKGIIISVIIGVASFGHQYMLKNDEDGITEPQEADPVARAKPIKPKKPARLQAVSNQENVLSSPEDQSGVTEILLPAGLESCLEFDLDCVPIKVESAIYNNLIAELEEKKALISKLKVDKDKLPLWNIAARLEIDRAIKSEESQILTIHKKIKDEKINLIKGEEASRIGQLTDNERALEFEANVAVLNEHAALEALNKHSVEAAEIERQYVEAKEAADNKALRAAMKESKAKNIEGYQEAAKTAAKAAAKIAYAQTIKHSLETAVLRESNQAITLLLAEDAADKAVKNAGFSSARIMMAQLAKIEAMNALEAAVASRAVVSPIKLSIKSEAHELIDALQLEVDKATSVLQIEMNRVKREGDRTEFERNLEVSKNEEFQGQLSATFTTENKAKRESICIKLIAAKQAAIKAIEAFEVAKVNEAKRVTFLTIEEKESEANREDAIKNELEARKATEFAVAQVAEARRAYENIANYVSKVERELLQARKDLQRQVKANDAKDQASSAESYNSLGVLEVAMGGPADAAKSVVTTGVIKSVLFTKECTTQFLAEKKVRDMEQELREACEEASRLEANKNKKEDILTRVTSFFQQANYEADEACYSLCPAVRRAIYDFASLEVDKFLALKKFAEVKVVNANESVKTITAAKSTLSILSVTDKREATKALKTANEDLAQANRFFEAIKNQINSLQEAIAIEAAREAKFLRDIGEESENRSLATQESDFAQLAHEKAGAAHDSNEAERWSNVACFYEEAAKNRLKLIEAQIERKFGNAIELGKAANTAKIEGEKLLKTMAGSSLRKTRKDIIERIRLEKQETRNSLKEEVLKYSSLEAFLSERGEELSLDDIPISHESLFYQSLTAQLKDKEASMHQLKADKDQLSSLKVTARAELNKKIKVLEADLSTLNLQLRNEKIKLIKAEELERISRLRDDEKILEAAADAAVLNERKLREELEVFALEVVQLTATYDQAEQAASDKRTRAMTKAISAKNIADKREAAKTGTKAEMKEAEAQRIKDALDLAVLREATMEVAFLLAEDAADKAIQIANSSIPRIITAMIAKIEALDSLQSIKINRSELSFSPKAEVNQAFILAQQEVDRTTKELLVELDRIKRKIVRVEFRKIIKNAELAEDKKIAVDDVVRMAREKKAATRFWNTAAREEASKEKAEAKEQAAIISTEAEKAKNEKDFAQLVAAKQAAIQEIKKFEAAKAIEAERVASLTQTEKEAEANRVNAIRDELEATKALELANAEADKATNAYREAIAYVPKVQSDLFCAQIELEKQMQKQAKAKEISQRINIQVKARALADPRQAVAVPIVGAATTLYSMKGHGEHFFAEKKVRDTEQELQDAQEEVVNTSAIQNEKANILTKAIEVAKQAQNNANRACDILFLEDRLAIYDLALIECKQLEALRDLAEAEEQCAIEAVKVANVSKTSSSMFNLSDMAKAAKALQIANANLSRACRILNSIEIRLIKSKKAADIEYDREKAIHKESTSQVSWNIITAVKRPTQAASAAWCRVIQAVEATTRIKPEIPLATTKTFNISDEIGVKEQNEFQAVEETTTIKARVNKWEKNKQKKAKDADNSKHHDSSLQISLVKNSTMIGNSFTGFEVPFNEEDPFAGFGLQSHVNQKTASTINLNEESFTDLKAPFSEEDPFAGFGLQSHVDQKTASTINLNEDPFIGFKAPFSEEDPFAGFGLQPHVDQKAASTINPNEDSFTDLKAPFNEEDPFAGFKKGSEEGKL